MLLLGSWFWWFLEVWVTRDVNSAGHKVQCLARLICFISILRGSIIDTTCVSKVTTANCSKPHVHYKQANLANAANIRLSPTASPHRIDPGPCPRHGSWTQKRMPHWGLFEVSWDWQPGTYNTSEPLRTPDPLFVVHKGFSFHQLLRDRG